MVIRPAMATASAMAIRCIPSARGLSALLGQLLALVVVLSGWLGWAQPSHASTGSEGTASSEQVRVLGHLPMKLSASEQREFEAKTLALAKITRAQDGVINYSCNADIEHPGTYVFDEIWPSEQALATHLETEHFKAWWAWVEPRLDGELDINLTATSNLHPFG